ncbi:dolichyl-diphosphooligosaccharide--protein glycosyltransferase subunit 2-like [Iris pallida]|uniref:Dolichyl-diphosphooligosaccharide--protein glycosyltransferase subunit 2-like n=1 Tax=Iris pallida TaxID=29817 RepID=A0AAX6DW27_IRIPA|nr:dolichyl-diphosphooligosaccharide--protein glycosyltransferase subunit 2-like [Iris pallida]
MDSVSCLENNRQTWTICSGRPTLFWVLALCLDFAKEKKVPSQFSSGNPKNKKGHPNLKPNKRRKGAASKSIQIERGGFKFSR